MPTIGKIFVKTTPTAWTLAKTAYARTAPGPQTPVFRIYKKTGVSTWTVIYERDVTPPPPPQTLVGTMSGSTLTMSAKAPIASDMKQIVFRHGNTAYPTSITGGDGGTTVTAASGQTVSASYGSQVSGRILYWAAFAVDTSGNVSAPKLLKYVTPKIVTTTPVVTKTGYFLPTDSGSWNDVSDYWRTDNNYVYQGGFFWHGMWFYSTRITSALAKAKSINSMKIQITRVNSVHGISGEAQVYLTAHDLATQPSGNPNTHDTAGTLVGGLNRGETKSFTVPSKYYAGFLSHTYKGFGLFWGETSFTDPKYLYTVGAGSAVSGRVYISWTE